MADQLVKQLFEAFGQTLSPNPALIKQAEAFLKAAVSQPGYAIAVLKLVSSDSPVEIRQAAAVNFKNHVKYHWAPSEHAQHAGMSAIPASEKEAVKASITQLMLSAPPAVRAQLSEALTIISVHDFPAAWQTLLPDLIARMQSADAAEVQGVLETANAIYKRYRNQFMTDALNTELQYSQQLVEPLLAVLRRLTARVKAGGEAAALRQTLTSVRLVLRIFYSLNSPGLTEDFERSLDAWMAEFHTLLTYDNAALAEADPECESVVEAVKAAVCQNINLFMEMNEEEFAKFLATFVQAVWMQLVQVSLRPGQDNLAMAATRFLTTVARSVHHALFHGADVLKQVCENIVIPNIRIRADQEEMFEMNWVEYVRRDTEGSDSDTRRRAATELVRALTAKFPQEVTALFTGYVSALLEEAAANPAGAWQAKDCAIYLVTALTVRGRTAAAGATDTNQLVALPDFYARHIAPELAAPDVNDRAVIKADALKFLTTFRGQLPKAVCLEAFPHLVRLLGAEANVVHSYAAIAIDRLLTQKEGGKPRYAVTELQPLLQPLLTALFAAFRLPESAENEYLMKAVMRVISYVAPEIAPVALTCLQALAAMLLEVCKNPTQPGFSHFLFESVAALVRFTAAAGGGAGGVERLEQQLFPAFQLVLQQDVQEFHPYVFQIFAQLIELRPAPLPATYLAIFPPLLAPVFWERHGNVPTLVRLLRAYLAKAASEILQQGHLQAVLGVFQKLVASKAQDHEGFRLLGAVAAHVPLPSLQPFLPTVWGLLFQRLQSARTPKFVRGFLAFLAGFIQRHGASATAASIDAVQSGLFTGGVLAQVWVPGLTSSWSDAERRLMAVATTKVLCECAELQAPAAGALWGQLLAALLRMLEDTAGEGAAADRDGDGADGDDEFGGYTAAFAQLHNAARPSEDPTPDVQDPPRHLAAELARFSQAHPGRVPALVQASVAAEQQQRLQAYCQAAGVSIA